MSAKTWKSVASTSSKLDSPTTMRVCRVCLAASVKMYHMSEHQLSVMYEGVTGVEIHTDDKLPQMLCWECVGRLTSANNFKKKALKTQRILLNQIKDGQFITLNNIKSIDRIKNQLESTLGYKYKVNDSNLNIIEDIKVEVNDNKSVEEGYKICDEDRGLVEVKVEVDIDINEELNDENDVRYQIIKTEPVEIDVDVNNDGEMNNEIVDISIVKTEINDDDEVINIIPSNEMINENTDEDVFSPLWNMKFLPRVNPLERAGRNKDTDQLITFQSPSGNEQKNITEANRTGENLRRKTQRTDITKLRICGACNKSLRSIKTATDTNNRHVIKLNYKTLQRTSNDTTDSCDMCNKAFPRNAQTFFFKCTFCDFETNSKYRLNTHINARHTKRIRYTCCYCNFKTYVKVKLGSHVNVTHKECLTCLYCGYVAKFKSYLNKHLCAQHSDTKVFSCNFCTYSSKQKGSLDKHVVDVHTEIAASS